MQKSQTWRSSRPRFMLDKQSRTVQVSSRLFNISCPTEKLGLPTVQIEQLPWCCDQNLLSYALNSCKQWLERCRWEGPAVQHPCATKANRRCPSVGIRTLFFIPRPPWRTSKLSEKPSALPPKRTSSPALQNTKFLHVFIFLCVMLQVNFSPPRSGYSQPKSKRIHADPDPQQTGTRRKLS